MKTKAVCKKSLLGDIIVLLVIVFACVIMLVSTGFNRQKANCVQVYLDGRLVNTLDLDENCSYSPNNGQNIICVSDGCAYMSYSTCQNQSCVLMGKINGGGFISCVPNKVYICATKQDSVFDAVAG